MYNYRTFFVLARNVLFNPAPRGKLCYALKRSLARQEFNFVQLLTPRRNENKNAKINKRNKTQHSFTADIDPQSKHDTVSQCGSSYGKKDTRLHNFFNLNLYY